MSLNHLIQPKDIKRETNYDIIEKAHQEHRINELPELLQKQYERWCKVNDLIRVGRLVKKGKHNVTSPYRYHEIINFLVEEYGVSTRTAREDIRHTKFFFSITDTKQEKEFARGVMIEWGEQLMFEAAGTGDYKSAAAFFKALLTAKGLDRDDIDAPDYANVQIPHLVVVADPKELGFEAVSDDEINRTIEKVNKNRRRSVLDKMIDQADEAQIIDELKIIPHGNRGTEDLA